MCPLLASCHTLFKSGLVVQVFFLFSLVIFFFVFGLFSRDEASLYERVAARWSVRPSVGP